MGKMSCLVVLFVWLINLGLGFGGVSGEKACNSTLGECFSYGGDMEFLGGEEAGDLLRHYAAGARWLLQSKVPIGDRTLMTNPICKSGQYPNCAPRGDSIRSCPPYKRCKRDVSGRIK